MICIHRMLTDKKAGSNIKESDNAVHHGEKEVLKSNINKEKQCEKHRCAVFITFNTWFHITTKKHEFVLCGNG